LKRERGKEEQEREEGKKTKKISYIRKKKSCFLQDNVQQNPRLNSKDISTTAQLRPFPMKTILLKDGFKRLHLMIGH
jgi:hypothetical protein